MCHWDKVVFLLKIGYQEALFLGVFMLCVYPPNILTTERLDIMMLNVCLLDTYSCYASRDLMSEKKGSSRKLTRKSNLRK